MANEIFICNLAATQVPEIQSSNNPDQSKRYPIEKGQEALPSYAINS